MSAIRIASGAKYARDSPWGILRMPDTMHDVLKRQKSCTRTKNAFETATGTIGKQRRREERRPDERRPDEREARRGKERRGEARRGEQRRAEER